MILSTLVGIFAFVTYGSAQWIAQGYSGQQCTGQRIASVQSNGNDVEWDCIHLNNIGGQAASLLISVNGDAANSYAFGLHQGEGACNDEVFGSINRK
jgi:hypothetical protein